MLVDPPTTLVDIWNNRVQRTPHTLAFQALVDGKWRDHTWYELGQQVRRIASGFRSIGMVTGDKVALLSSTRLEWIMVDFGALSAGSTITTIYPSNTPKQCAYILNNSESQAIVVENQTQLDKIIAVRADLRHLQHIIIIDGETSDEVTSLSDLEARGAHWDTENPGALDKIVEELSPADLACLIYTSGTTGDPKGVMLDHDGFVQVALAVEADSGDWLTPAEKQYLFLPLAHVYGKIMELIAVHLGVPTAINGDINGILPGLEATRPTFMAAVPRVFEKAYNSVLHKAKSAGDRKYKVFQWAVGVGREVSQLRQRQQEPTGWLYVKYRIADRLVFSKVQGAFGGRMRFFGSGGAPLSQEIAEFFHAAGMLILEGYGMTETSAISTANRPEDFRFGSVGKTGDDLNIKIASDGEILIKGPTVMRGYYKMPEVTAESLVDGWMHTGDIGRFDDDGFLYITDRKKNIIVTSGGKNIAPQKIENMIKAQCEFISQALLHGDRRNFCTALITIDEETTEVWAKQHGLSYNSYAELAALPKVRDLVAAAVEQVNDRLASYESIKNFAILDHDLTIDNDELTPSMKVRRRVVEDRHKAVLDGFYEGTVASL